MAESAEKAAHEQQVYKTLMANPHPHVLWGILLIPEGIFMERMAGTLHDRIKAPLRSRPPPPDELERRRFRCHAPKPGREYRIAGSDTEQFALASCIYNIRFGEEPLAWIDPPEDCWHEKFESVAAVDEKLRKLLGADGLPVAVEDPGRGEMLLADCYRFLEKEGLEKEKI
ncbi:hypothetical protein N0V84_011735 [Fusarium piperis]|uniref:Uncharacterized protein n=1 Tax=Fusarium piperis TaxID=1435070 RepID=A0A9W8TDC5_9HYPO|nr:hypothetical protein N0V84_011735 [Fusarium piperis]